MKEEKDEPFFPWCKKITREAAKGAYEACLDGLGCLIWGIGFILFLKALRWILN